MENDVFLTLMIKKVYTRDKKHQITIACTPRNQVYLPMTD